MDLLNTHTHHIHTHARARAHTHTHLSLPHSIMVLLNKFLEEEVLEKKIVERGEEEECWEMLKDVCVLRAFCVLVLAVTFLLFLVVLLVI